MNTLKILVIGIAAIAAVATHAQQGQCQTCPMMQGDQHAKGVDSRGDKAMGFNHDKTQHHFRLFADGGSIDVVVIDAGDSGQLQAIRSHLKMIKGMFAKGDFHLPMFIHDQTVPGQKTMQALKSSITYTYEDLPQGGRVRIQTTNPKALAAIHNFARFQVKDHRTGDTGKVEKP